MSGELSRRGAARTLRQRAHPPAPWRPSRHGQRAKPPWRSSATRPSRVGGAVVLIIGLPPRVVDVLESASSSSRTCDGALPAVSPRGLESSDPERVALIWSRAVDATRKVSHLTTLGRRSPWKTGREAGASTSARATSRLAASRGSSPEPSAGLPLRGWSGGSLATPSGRLRHTAAATVGDKAASPSPPRDRR